MNWSGDSNLFRCFVSVHSHLLKCTILGNCMTASFIARRIKMHGFLRTPSYSLSSLDHNPIYIVLCFVLSKDPFILTDWYWIHNYPSYTSVTSATKFTFSIQNTKYLDQQNKRTDVATYRSHSATSRNISNLSIRKPSISHSGHVTCSLGPHYREIKGAERPNPAHPVSSSQQALKIMTTCPNSSWMTRLPDHTRTNLRGWRHSNTVDFCFYFSVSNRCDAQSTFMTN